VIFFCVLFFAILFLLYLLIDSGYLNIFIGLKSTQYYINLTIMIFKIIVLVVVSIIILIIIISIVPIVYIYTILLLYNISIFIIDYKVTEKFELLFVTCLIIFNFIIIYYSYIIPIIN